MNEVFQTTNRRTLLQRGLLFLGGVLGLPLAELDTRSEPVLPVPAPPPAPESGKTLRLYARQLLVHCPNRNPGGPTASAGRLQTHGDLLAQPNGAKLGQFSATCFAPESQFGPVGLEHTVELQTLRLAQGTLFGIGTAGPIAKGDRAHAILGGTGCFAGASGTYVIRQSPSGHGDQNVEFEITLSS